MNSPRPDTDNQPAPSPGTERRSTAGAPRPATPNPQVHGPQVAPQVHAPQVARELTWTLAVFGAASVVAGSALARSRHGATEDAFGQQSAMWGAINLAIAGVGAWRSGSHPAKAGPLRRTLLINAALDVGYVATGAHIANHRSTLGGRVSRDAALGHGLAMVGQGLGLLTLDLHYARRLSS